jgi:hypothetical protein
MNAPIFWEKTPSSRSPWMASNSSSISLCCGAPIGSFAAQAWIFS